MPYRKLLPSNLRGGGVFGWGVQIALGDQVLQQVDQGGTGIRTGVQVHHVIGTAQLKQGLGLDMDGAHTHTQRRIITMKLFFSLRHVFEFYSLLTSFPDSLPFQVVMANSKRSMSSTQT